MCVHCSRNEEQGYINNQVLGKLLYKQTELHLACQISKDWNFKMDGILHNTSQDDTYDTVTRDVVTGAMDGYNGKM